MILPQKVLLRNGKRAFVSERVEDIPPFALFGYQENGPWELWREDGQWRADGTAHPLDILGWFDAGNKFHALTAASKSGFTEGGFTGEQKGAA